MRLRTSQISALGVFALAVSICACAPAEATSLPALVAPTKPFAVEARASRYFYVGPRRRRARRNRETTVAPSATGREREIALPKRNPRRLLVEGEASKASRVAAQAKSEPAPAPTPAPQVAAPVTTWDTDDVIAGRERCLVALARIVVEIDAAPPMRTGQCGTSSPVRLRSIGSGARRVTVQPPALLNCDMVLAVHDWLENTVQPTAKEILGEDIVRLESVAGYQCRNRARTTRLSEHALANAIDILGFTTRSGYTISVLDGWGPTQRDGKEPVTANIGPTSPAERSATGEPPLPLPHPKRVSRLKPITARASLKPGRAPAQRAPSIPTEQFLKRVHERSCETFKTVLGPEANEDHRNHFHLDLAQRKRGAHYCR